MKAAVLWGAADGRCGVAVFPTSTKDSAVIGVEALAAICAAVSIPVVAIGGVSAANARLAVEAGAAGVAVVSAVFGEEDIAAATQRILQVKCLSRSNLYRCFAYLEGCRQVMSRLASCAEKRLYAVEGFLQEAVPNQHLRAHAGG